MEIKDNLFIRVNDYLGNALFALRDVEKAKIYYEISYNKKLIVFGRKTV